MKEILKSRSNPKTFALNISLTLHLGSFKLIFCSTTFSGSLGPLGVKSEQLSLTFKAPLVSGCKRFTHKIRYQILFPCVLQSSAHFPDAETEA